jgi:ribose 1,5-bisphosphokinase PhnN
MAREREMRPRLVINPSTDAQFVVLAERIAERGLTSTDEFERRLRVDYPQAVVRSRQLADEPILIWYVYRDGRWVPPDPGG